MGIAVACNGLTIAPAFVNCSSYMYYEIEDGEPVSCRNIPAFDQALNKLPEFFQVIDATTLIAGRVDEEVLSTLVQSGIQVVSGKSGDPLSVVREILQTTAA